MKVGNYSKKKKKWLLRILRGAIQSQFAPMMVNMSCLIMCQEIFIALKEFGSDFQSPRDISINTLNDRDWHTDYLRTLMYDDKMDQFGIHAIGTFFWLLSSDQETYGNYVAKLNRDFSKKWEVRDTILYYPSILF